MRSQAEVSMTSACLQEPPTSGHALERTVDGLQGDLLPDLDEGIQVNQVWDWLSRSVASVTFALQELPTHSSDCHAPETNYMRFFFFLFYFSCTHRIRVRCNFGAVDPGKVENKSLVAFCGPLA